MCGHTYLHKAHLFLQKMTALMCFDKFTYQSQATLYLFFFFSSSLLIFASIFLWAFDYKAKVTIMPTLCLKHNAPVCQRPQLCERK